MSLSAKFSTIFGVFTRWTEYLTETNGLSNANLRTVLFAPQRRDMGGTVDDDPFTRWVVTRVKASLTAVGTIQLFQVNSSTGVSKAISPAWSIPDTGGVDLECYVEVDAGCDVCYTATGGGDSRVELEAFPETSGHSLRAMEIAPASS